ncbi:IS30 family transposase, partial [Aggregatibacter actinomycetemcomitans]|nr:IS30 family transposase [Aggregatibacter actinomycetemcomitans]MBN6082205.1 IS30 family transposase [Aggregatibacter actinomycetemcomitans]MBN6084360.1 IS30 family transposase [Aggregatibacter actinomycetemcomitans]
YSTIYRAVHQGWFDIGERKAARKLRTPDRGKEFAKHRLVTQALGAGFYFPEPHQPWQRGANENTNGLLREYFPN